MEDLKEKKRTPYVESWGAVLGDGSGKLSGKERSETLADVAEGVSLALETIPVMFEALAVGNCSDRAGDACGFLSVMLTESAQRTIELLHEDRRSLERNNTKLKKQASDLKEIQESTKPDRALAGMSDTIMSLGSGYIKEYGVAPVLAVGAVFLSMLKPPARETLTGRIRAGAEHEIAKETAIELYQK